MGVPLLLPNGAAIPGHVYSYSLVNSVPGSVGALFTGLGEQSVPLPEFGATLYLANLIPLGPFVVGPDGTAPQLSLLNPIQPVLCGLPFIKQAVILDPSAMGGIAFTQAVRVRFGAAGSGSLLPNERIPVGSSPRDIQGADFNGDGFLDVAVPNFNDDTVSVLLGLDSGRFAPATHLSVSDGPQSVAIADYNGDSLLDLAVGCSAAGSIDVLFGDGVGGFAAPETLSLGQAVRSIAAADLNSDGLQDLLMLTEGSLFGGGALVRFLGVGGGAFGAPAFFGNFTLPRDLTVADLDSDGTPDAIIASEFTNTVAVLRGRANGSFTAAQSYPAGLSPRAVSTGDFDGDGLLDVVAPGRDAGAVAVLRGIGAGQLSAPQLFPVGFLSSSVSVGDINGDAHVDLVVGFGSDGRLSYLQGDGAGQFTSGRVSPAGGPPIASLVADVSGDGVPDVLTVSDPSGDLSIGFGDGTGAFGDFGSSSAVPGLAVGGPVARATGGDFNGDGRPDIAVTNNSEAIVHISTPSGLLQRSDEFFVGPFITTVESGDINGDGLDDLAFLAAQDTTPIYVHLALGDGTFAPGTTIPTAVRRDSIAFEDLNGDGQIDIVTSGSSVAVQLATGPGSFGAPVEYHPTEQNSLMKVADISGDGILDVLVAGELQPDIDVLLGLGDGTLAAPVPFPIGFGGGVRAFDTADLDEDGIVDLAVSKALLGAVVVLPGLGSGQFGPPIDLAAGQQSLRPASQLTSVDINADGLLDLVSTETDDNAIAVRINLGALNFLPRQRFVCWNNAAQFVVADFDGNGTADIATGDSSSDGISVLANGLVD